MAEADSSGSFVIRGRKSIVANADRVDYLIVFARSAPKADSEKRSESKSAFLVNARDPSIIARRLDKLGMDFVNNFDLEINNLRVGSEAIVGTIGKEWYENADVFAMDRILTSASLLGTARLAISQAAERAKHRPVFGKAIGSNQGIQFPLADAMALIISAEAIMLKAAWLVLGENPFLNDANYALLLSSQAGILATDRALQTFGGHGYYKDYDVERYWRDVRAHKIHLISEELLPASIAERAPGLPKSY